MFLKVLLISIILLINIPFSGYSQTKFIENRKKLEIAVNENISTHYLFKNCQLQDDNKWLSIELKSKTWKNPNDTKALIDSIIKITKNFAPFSANKNSEFQIYIDEPKSGFPIATVRSYSTKTYYDYSFSEWQTKAKEKLFGIRQSTQYVSEEIKFGRPIMSMWSGVKLYYGSGSSKKFVGKIVCFSGDLVMIKYPSGSIESKYRSVIIDLKGKWYIDKNDPALNAMEYYTCD